MIASKQRPVLGRLVALKLALSFVIGVCGWADPTPSQAVGWQSSVPTLRYGFAGGAESQAKTLSPLFLEKVEIVNESVSPKDRLASGSRGEIVIAQTLPPLHSILLLWANDDISVNLVSSVQGVARFGRESLCQFEHQAVARNNRCRSSVIYEMNAVGRFAVDNGYIDYGEDGTLSSYGHVGLSDCSVSGISCCIGCHARGSGKTNREGAENGRENRNYESRGSRNIVMVAVDPVSDHTAHATESGIAFFITIGFFGLLSALLWIAMR